MESSRLQPPGKQRTAALIQLILQCGKALLHIQIQIIDHRISHKGQKITVYIYLFYQIWICFEGLFSINAAADIVIQRVDHSVYLRAVLSIITQL